MKMIDRCPNVYLNPSYRHSVFRVIIWESGLIEAIFSLNHHYQEKKNEKQLTAMRPLPLSAP